MKSRKGRKSPVLPLTITTSEKEIEEARKILGALIKDWSDEQVREEIAQTKYLVETWLDEFERKTFDGKTIAEIVPGFNLPDPFKR